MKFKNFFYVQLLWYFCSETHEQILFKVRSNPKITFDCFYLFSKSWSHHVNSTPPTNAKFDQLWCCSNPMMVMLAMAVNNRCQMGPNRPNHLYTSQNPNCQNLWVQHQIPKITSITTCTNIDTLHRFGAIESRSIMDSDHCYGRSKNEPSKPLSIHRFMSHLESSNDR